MPPMSRPLMTAWATVSSIASDRSGFQQRRALVFLREDARQIAVLPLHPDRMAVDILAVGSEFHLAARTHRGVTRGNVEGGDGIADLLRIGGSGALQRIGDHKSLRHQ